MAQATPKKKPKPGSTGHGAPGWVWGVTGLAIGLAIGLAAYLQQGPARTKTKAGPVANAPAAAPGAPSNTLDFDFYELLPEMEVPVPESAKPESLRKPGTYFLQVGSFRAFSDADRLKAELALLGVEAHIEPVFKDSGVSWYRVRVGPSQDLRALNKIRTRLLNNDYEALLQKNKE
ncbi:MAG TPA: SPOR domain-containing protein [Gammaproteobacteria bacterium]|nr:SPOR domain-containing protein [Gammaproteobacteria bacterium]